MPVPMRIPLGTSLFLHRATNPLLHFQVQIPSISRRLSSDRLQLLHHISSLTLSGGTFLPRETERRGRCGFSRFRARPGDKLVHLKRSSYYCSCSSDPVVVVANDGKYGLKPVISITPRLYDYILSNVREPEVGEHSTFSNTSCIMYDDGGVMLNS